MKKYLVLLLMFFSCSSGAFIGIPDFLNEEDKELALIKLWDDLDEDSIEKLLEKIYSNEIYQFIKNKEEKLNFLLRYCNDSTFFYKNSSFCLDASKTLKKWSDMNKINPEG